MADIEQRRSEFYNPNFDRGLASLRWARDGRQDRYADVIDSAWKIMLGEDTWYEWLSRNRDSLKKLHSDVWFEDERSFTVRKARGRLGVTMTVPSEVFDGEVGAIELMRAVIYMAYLKGAQILNIEEPPRLDEDLDALSRRV